MFGIFESATRLVSNVASVALAPVEMAVDLTAAASEPFADAAKDMVADVKSLTK